MSFTPLYSAVRSGDLDKARELLKRGRYDVNCRDKYGWTLLHEASSSGHVDMVRMLIAEFQADTTLQDGWGNTPLHMAASLGRGEVALTLITEFANLPNSNGYTSLHTACEKRDANVVRIIGKYASVLTITKDGDTPLHIAAERGVCRGIAAIGHSYNAKECGRKNSKGCSTLWCRTTS